MPSLLERLLAADHSHPEVARIPEDVWLEYVEHIAETLDVGPGTSVFEVGCGTGALLLPLSENGYPVGGQDESEARLRLARDAMPQGRWERGRAAELDPAEPWDVVIVRGLPPPIADLDDARALVARMSAKATHAIALLDLLEQQAPAIEGHAEMAADRRWLLRTLSEIGVSAVQFEEQVWTGRGPDRPRRFNVYARV